nr:hypothetical protein [Tanacetum cinerariifolium]
MRIKQYFLMTYYSLWEVILNGDSPTLTRIVNGVVQFITPTTAEQRECRSSRDNMNKDTPRRIVPVEVSTSNALVSQCDAVGGYDWSFQADEEPINYALIAYASSCSSSSSGSNNDVAPYSKACIESVEARLVVYQQNENVFEEDIKLLKLDVMLRDNALVKLKKKFEKVEKERDDLKITLEKFHTSSKNLSKLLESQVSDKTGLGYNSQVFNSQVFDCKDSNNSVPKIQESDKYMSGEGYHAVHLPYTKTFMPPKPDLVFNDAPTASESIAHMVNIESSLNKPSKDMSKTLRNVVPTAGLSRSRLVSLNTAIPVPTAGNPQQALKDKGVIDHGCSRHMTGNISYLSDFEEINEGYVAIRGNPKGGKNTCKVGIRRVVPRNYNPKGERFLIASPFPTPPLACAFFSLRATEMSSSKLPRDQTSNPTSSANPTPKGQIRRSSKQKVENSHFEENLTPVDTMTDNRTMVKMLRAPTEGCAEAIVVPPILAEQFELKHSLINMMTSKQFFGLEKDNPHDHVRCAVTTAMTAMLKQFQSNPPPAQVKAVEEICVTCRGAHPYYQCLAAGGNTFQEYRDNIQDYVSAATENFNQGNPGYRPQGVANQMRPPGFAQPNVQNNQNRFSQPQGFNRPNFNQEQPYQATQSNQNFHLNELEKIKRMNDSLKAMQNQIDMMNTASALGSRTLPGNTIANPKGKLKAITTRSRLVTEGPTVPNPPKPVNPEEDECVEERYMDPDHAEYNIKVPPPPPVQKPKTPIQKKDDIQIQKFWNMFKQLHLNITLAEALVLKPKYQKMLKALLSNKEKLQKLANTPLNENCSAVILKKLPEKLRDPGKFLIPCKALADLGASINLMPLSVWKKLGLPDLIPTQMTLELANHAICTPDGIARGVFVPVGERKPRKGQNRIKIGQKQEACRSREKFKAIAVGRGRKTEQNAKRMAETQAQSKAIQVFKERRKEKGQKCKF